MDELPWQLARGKAWPRLRDRLTDTDFLSVVWKFDRAGVLGYWSALESSGGCDIAAAYKTVVDSPSSCSWWGLCAVIQLLQSRRPALSRMLGAIVVSKHLPSLDGEELIEALRQDVEFAEWALDLWSKEVVFGLKDSNAHATWNRLTQLAEMSKRLGYRRLFAAQLVRMAEFKAAMTGPDGADGLLTLAEEIAVELLDDSLLEMIYSLRAEMLAAGGRDDEALAMLARQRLICEAAGLWDRLAQGLNDAGAILINQGNLDKAMRTLRDAETLCRQYGCPNELARALGNQALAYKGRRLFDKAKDRLGESEQIVRKQLQLEPLERIHNQRLVETLANQSVIAAELQDYARARRLADTAAATAEGLGGLGDQVHRVLQWVREKCG